jgi:peptide/nickel transport system substrate-binding protein
VYVSALTTAPTGDPEYFFAATCRSDSSKNFGGYASPALDSLAEQLHVTFGADERAKIATQMSQTILDDHGYFFVSFLQMGIVSKANVKGMAAHPCDYYEITAALDV